MLELDEDAIEAFPVDGLVVPLVRMTSAPVPPVQLRVEGHDYQYDSSYPIKGYAAIMPSYIKEQIAGGKRPLLVERPDRFYVYFAA
jgi:hypothetical protein